MNDPARLAALDSYAILDTPAEPGFDGIVRLACRLCDAPVALVGLVAADRQWFKARQGFAGCETGLDGSVCVHALEHRGALLVIPDLTADPRTRADPLVTGEPFFRFYAGAPLVTPEGHALGSLCVIDTQPRPEGLTPAQQDDLRVLAQQVVSQLELRRAIIARDAVRAAEGESYRARDALKETQTALATADDRLLTILDAVVRGAMQAIPAADGGAAEILAGDELEYRAVAGTLAAHAGLRLPLAGSAAGHCARTLAPYRVVDAATDPRVRRELVETLRLGSAIYAPIRRANAALGVLKLQSRRTGAFTERDLALLDLFAGVTTASLATAEARDELRAAESYWRDLFERLQEGFIVGEAVRDGQGRIADWRYIEVNAAWGDLLSIDPAAVLGRTIRETIPDIEEEWITDLAGVVDTGEAVTFTHRVGPLHRWYEGRAFPLEGDRFGVIFLEATQRVATDERRAALLAVGDSLRDLTSIGDMTRAASEIVGRTLNATRAGFGRLVGDVEYVEIEPDWTAAGQASIAGRHRFDDYGDIRAHLARGEPLVIDDVVTDPRTRHDPEPMLAIGIGALVNMPVRERGRTVAVFIVHDTQPRAWTTEELAFLRNVADRLEAGVARVRAEELQDVLNAELAHRLKNTLAIVQSIAASTLSGVAERDLVESFERRVLALSRAHDVLMQKSWSAARLRAVMEGVLSMQADLDRFAFDGPDMDINPQAALSLSLLLHELATNALKYGALSKQAGTVKVAWRTEDGGAPSLVLDWTERGGPAVTPPSNRGGFGSKLIRMGLMGTRESAVHYDPTGLKAEFRAPLVEIQVQVH